MLQPWDAYLLYNAIKLHFESDSYDALKYNFKTSAKAKSFIMRKDRFFFAKLTKRYPDRQDMVNFLVANFTHNTDATWSGDLIEQEAEEAFTLWKKRMESWSYNFTQEVDTLANYVEMNKLQPDDLLIAKNGNPPLVQLQVQGKVSLETLVAFDLVFNFMGKTGITETIFWPSYSRKVHKYRPFLKQQIDLEKVRNTIISRFTQA